MKGIEKEGLSKKGVRSSVGYVMKLSITTTGQIAVRSITEIMSRVNDQFLLTLMLCYTFTVV